MDEITELSMAVENYVPRNYERFTLKGNLIPYPDKITRTSYQSGRDYTRELARQRDGRQCKDCGKRWRKGQRRLDVHHLGGLCGKLSTKYDKIETLDNLITLCHRCHFNHPTHTLSTNKK